MKRDQRIADAKRTIRARSHDGIERRVVPARVELRDAEDDWFRVVGHAAVFNALSEDLGGFKEIIDPGFFDNVLNDDVRALFNHDPNLVLARLKVQGPGELALVQDAKGLDYDFLPTVTSYARDLHANLEAGVVDQSSFAFRVRRGGEVWSEDEKGNLIRRLLKGGASALYDVSPVTYPAYLTTDSGLASAPTVAVAEPRRELAPARAARARRLEVAERAMKDEAAPERKARKRVMERAGWPGWNDDVGAGLTPARTSRSIDLAIKAEPEVTSVDAMYADTVQRRIRLHEQHAG